MRRRELLLAATALMAARAARAQQKAMPVIGWLSGVSPAPYASFLAAFRQGLSEAGYVEGQNMTIEYRGLKVITIGSPIWPPTSLGARLT